MQSSYNEKLVKDFIAHSGFTVLALAKLSPCEYGLFLFLFQRAASGFEQVISNEEELAQILNYSQDELALAVKKLEQQHLIRVHYGHHEHTQETHPSLYLQVQGDLSRWKIGVSKASTSKILNFKGTEVPPAAPHLVVEKGPRTWQRVVQAFCQYQELEAKEKEASRSAAESLVNAHPVDQVLLMIHHFQLRVPGLSKLLSSWEEFQVQFEQETQQIDMDQAREKHLELDTVLRKSIKEYLSTQQQLKLSAEEVEVLEIILSHRFPRRQLFWAYQARSRYSNLRDFFAENTGLMLAVSSSGTVLKKPPR